MADSQLNLGYVYTAQVQFGAESSVADRPLVYTSPAEPVRF